MTSTGGVGEGITTIGGGGGDTRTLVGVLVRVGVGDGEVNEVMRFAVSHANVPLARSEKAANILQFIIHFLPI